MTVYRLIPVTTRPLVGLFGQVHFEHVQVNLFCVIYSFILDGMFLNLDRNYFKK